MFTSDQWISALEQRVLLSAGDLDTSFGKGGFITQSFGGEISDAHVAVQRDQKILVAMRVTPPKPAKPEFVLARFTRNGKLDPTFGKAGEVIMPLAGTPVSNILVDPTGRITVWAGKLLSFSADGKLQSSIGSGRSVSTSLGDFTLLSSGKIIADTQRLLADGSPDPSFAKVKLPYTYDSDIGTVPLKPTWAVPAPDGGVYLLVIGGDGMSGDIDGGIVRLTSSGKIDKTFGHDGIVRDQNYTIAENLRVTPSGNLLLLTDSDIDESFLHEFSASGVLDSTFGRSPPLDFVELGEGFNAALLVDTDEKIIVANYDSPTVVDRLNPDGTSDEGFGVSGQATLSALGDFATIDSALSPNRDIVLIGNPHLRGSLAPTNKLEIARILGSPPHKPLASLSNGLLTVTGTSGNDFINIQASNGSINVSVNDGQFSFPMRDVKHLLVNAGDGDDFVFDVANILGATLNGGAGNDRLESNFNSVLNGGTGADTLVPHHGGITLTGGGGNDTADFSEYGNDLSITLDNKSNDGPRGDQMNVQADIENIIGGSGNDLIIGGPFANHLYGGPGNDTLWGGGGNDTLEGGHGHDDLFGQAGDDLLIARDNTGDSLDGGDGADRASVDSVDQLLSIETIL